MNLILPILAALAMSVGWGFRGDYGHEAGAMVPGALVALAICLAARRADWWERGSLLAMLGAVGWAFGGQMSYGRVIGYTAHSSFRDVLYGFACLFAIGALWGGIGAGILALGVTRPRAELERFAGPLATLWIVWRLTEWSGLDDRLSSRWSLYDTDWTAASWALLVALAYGLIRPRSRSACRLIGELALGWWAGLLVLTLLLKLRMTPPRSDNWAGCVGLWIALVIHLWRTRDRAAMMLSLQGLLAGGVGFAVGDLFNMLGRAEWGPIGRYEWLQGLGSWKWMEQSFGLIMGFGVALGFERAARRLAPPIENEPAGPLRYVSLLFLLLGIWWQNLPRNVARWVEDGHLFDWVLRLAPQRWMLIVALLLSAIVVWAIVRYRREGLPIVSASAFGRGQLLFLLILWIAIVADFTQAFPVLKMRGVFFVHLTFWLTALACTLLALALRADPVPAETLSADDPQWLPGRKHALLWALALVLIFALAKAAVASHDGPLPGSHLRFGGQE
ncbi:MAG: hypothetical protein SF339_18615 [Blastocatellia bacterium]|nr:hypothetical protein [Blastocatellia bacterium]